MDTHGQPPNRWCTSWAGVECLRLGGMGHCRVRLLGNTCAGLVASVILWKAIPGAPEQPFPRSRGSSAARGSPCRRSGARIAKRTRRQRLHVRAEKRGATYRREINVAPSWPETQFRNDVGPGCPASCDFPKPLLRAWFRGYGALARSRHPFRLKPCVVSSHAVKLLKQPRRSPEAAFRMTVECLVDSHMPS